MASSRTEGTLEPDAVAHERLSRLRVPTDDELPQAILDIIAHDGEESLRAFAIDAEGLLKLFGFIGHVTNPEVGKLAAAERDLIATIVAAENRCVIAVMYHTRMLGDHLEDHERALRIAINPRAVRLSRRERAIAGFTIKYTRAAYDIGDEDIDRLRAAGLDDDEIFQVIQLGAAFNCTTMMESALGFSPTTKLWAAADAKVGTEYNELAG